MDFSLVRTFDKQDCHEKGEEKKRNDVSNAMTNDGEESHQTEILPESYPKFIVAINPALHGLVHD